MTQIVQQIGLFSPQPLRGYYRYRDLFQIVPVAKQNELFQHDHPLILEISFFPEVWPNRYELLWYRDIWERERFEYIRDHSSQREMDPSDDWVKEYQDQTTRLRLPAIVAETSTLLTLFANHRFFDYQTQQHWFIPLPPTDEDSRRSVWGQIGYHFDMPESDGGFSTPTAPEVLRIPLQKYYSRVRDAIYRGEDNTVKLSDNIDQLFDIYFGLDRHCNLGSDQAILLIFQDKHSKNRCSRALKNHFWGQNYAHKGSPLLELHITHLPPTLAALLLLSQADPSSLPRILCSARLYSHSIYFPESYS